MSTQIGQAYPLIVDKSGKPLDNGIVYIGESGQNPENYPIQIYYDEAFTIPVPQPIKTINGYFSRNGSPAKIFIKSVECSIVVKDKFKILQWLDLNYSGILSGKGIKASDVVDESGKSQQEINDQWVDVSLLMQDGLSNAGANTSRLLAARDAARSLNKGLRCAQRNTVYLNDDIDFSGIKYIDFQANIILLENKQIYHGNNARGADFHKIVFKNVTNGNNTTTSEPPTRPVLKICGLKQSSIYVGQCNYIQLYADATAADTTSTAYNNIYLVGQTSKFEITDSGVTGAWVNENKIHGGRINHIHIIGKGGKHNKNEFYSPCMENADKGDGRVEIIFDYCSNNWVHYARLESVENKAVICRNSARSNYIIKNYGHDGGSRENFTDLSYIVTEDATSENNVITTYEAVYFDKTVVASFDALSDTVLSTSTASTSDSASILAPRDGYSALLTPNFNHVLVGNSSGREFITTDLIPVNRFDIFSVCADYDGSVGLIRFYLYDVDMNPIVTEGAEKLIMSPIFSTEPYNAEGFQTNGIARIKFELNQYPFLINNSSIKYVRICFRVSTPATIVRSVNITKFHKKHSGQNENYARTVQKKPLALNGMVMRGFARFGQSYYDSLARIQNTCIMSLETYATATAPSGSTVIKLKHVASATFSESTRSTVKAGDFIGVMMVNGSVHWSRIASISGNDVTLATALTFDVASGGMVRLNRWNYHTNAPSFAEMTVAANSSSNRNVSVQYATVGAGVKAELVTPVDDIIIYATVVSATSVKLTVRNLSSGSITIPSTNIRVIVENA